MSLCDASCSTFGGCTRTRVRSLPRISQPVPETAARPHLCALLQRRLQPAHGGRPQQEALQVRPTTAATTAAAAAAYLLLLLLLAVVPARQAAVEHHRQLALRGGVEVIQPLSPPAVLTARAS